MELRHSLNTVSPDGPNPLWETSLEFRNNGFDGPSAACGLGACLDIPSSQFLPPDAVHTGHAAGDVGLASLHDVSNSFLFGDIVAEPNPLVPDDAFLADLNDPSDRTKVLCMLASTAMASSTPELDLTPDKQTGWSKSPPSEGPSTATTRYGVSEQFDSSLTSSPASGSLSPSDDSPKLASQL